MYVAAGRTWRINPRYAIPAAIYRVVALWNRCQSGMGGLGHLPCAGAMNDQPNWLLEAFRILDDENETINAEKRP